MMRAQKIKVARRGGLFFGILVLCLSDGHAQLTAGNVKTNTQQHDTRRSGEHDFDFEIGTWKTHLEILIHPLTGSKTWIQYDGTSVVWKVWSGRANMVEFEVNGPPGHVEALSLRLYNPQSLQWSLNSAHAGTGTLGTPAVGEFKNGRGEFYDQEVIKGRASSFETYGRISFPIHAALSKHFPMTAERHGKQTGSQQTLESVNHFCGTGNSPLALRHVP